MKKSIFLIAILFFSVFNLKSQTVNDIPIKDIDVEYILIVGNTNILNNKVTVFIDFGQENKSFSYNDNRIKDENGQVMKFNSMIDALNFFSKNGYEFINAYAVTMQNANVYHYLLKKKIN